MTTTWPRRPTGSTRPSASTDPTRRCRLGRRRRARARHIVLGPLVQRAAAPRPLRRRPARRVRSSVLRCPTDRPRRGWNPIARASIRPRAVHQRRLPRTQRHQHHRRHRRRRLRPRHRRRLQPTQHRPHRHPPRPPRPGRARVAHALAAGTSVSLPADDSSSSIGTQPITATRAQR